MKEINYLEILKKSWRITWKNKYLWWFGLFLSLGGGSSFSFNVPGNNDWEKQLGEKGDLANDFFAQHWQIFIAGAVLLVLLIAAFVVLRIIAQAGLVKTLNRIENNEKGNFKEGFGEGKKYFWKLLKVGLILGFLMICLIVVLSLPVIFLFYLEAVFSGILATFLAVLIFIPLVIVSSFLGKYAFFYITLSDLGIRSSFERSYYLFRKNIIQSIIMSLLFIPVSIFLTFIFLTVFFLIGIFFLIIGIILYLAISKIGIVIAISAGLIVFLASLIFLTSVYQVFYQTVWFLFFKEIASVKMEEEVKETVKEIIEKQMPASEEA